MHQYSQNGNQEEAVKRPENKNLHGVISDEYGRLALRNPVSGHLNLFLIMSTIYINIYICPISLSCGTSSKK